MFHGVKVSDLLAIWLGGSLTSEMLANLNQGLETLALVLTIAGLLWRMFKRKKA